MKHVHLIASEMIVYMPLNEGVRMDSTLTTVLDYDRSRKRSNFSCGVLMCKGMYGSKDFLGGWGLAV